MKKGGILTTFQERQSQTDSRALMIPMALSWKRRGKLGFAQKFIKVRKVRGGFMEYYCRMSSTSCGWIMSIFSMRAAHSLASRMYNNKSNGYI